MKGKGRKENPYKRKEDGVTETKFKLNDLVKVVDEKKLYPPWWLKGVDPQYSSFYKYDIEDFNKECVYKVVFVQGRYYRDLFFMSGGPVTLYLIQSQDGSGSCYLIEESGIESNLKTSQGFRGLKSIKSRRRKKKLVYDL